MANSIFLFCIVLRSLKKGPKKPSNITVCIHKLSSKFEHFSMRNEKGKKTKLLRINEPFKTYLMFNKNDPGDLTASTTLIPFF